MKPDRTRDCAAFTVLELVVVLTVIVLFVLLLVPSLQEAKRKAQQEDCVGNLKQIGLAFRLWAPDSSDEYPMRRSTNYGGTREVANDVWRTFQVMSNELSTPKLLFCAADNRPPATSWVALVNANISYFIGLDADESAPEMLLTGDRNLTNGRPLLNRIFSVSTNEPVDWTGAIHKHRGNIGLADGTVQRMEREAVNRQIVLGLGELNPSHRTSTNPPQITLRLALPE